MAQFQMEICLEVGLKMKENVQAVKKDVTQIAMETSIKQFVLGQKIRIWELIQDVSMVHGMKRESTHSIAMDILKNIILVNTVILMFCHQVLLF